MLSCTIHVNDIDNNFYYHNNPDYFCQLKQLVEYDKKSFSRRLNTTKRHLKDWIDTEVPLLSNDIYTNATKIHWIFNNIQSWDNPLCKCCNCGKPYVEKNVRLDTGYQKYCSCKCLNSSEQKKNQVKDTVQLKYGVDNVFQAAEIKQKIRHTSLLRYGVENGGGSRQAQLKMRSKYFYDSQSFDSSWELAMYIYLKDHDIDFQYHPAISYTYKFNEHKFAYQPDFIVDDVVYELKGDHFFKNGKMICPYKKKSWTDEQYRALCEKYEAKHQCALENNVHILKSKEIQQYLDYINEKYGKNFLFRFKMKIHNN